MGGMGGWMADHHGWTSGFLTFGTIGLGLGAVLYCFLSDVPAANHANVGREHVKPLEAARALGKTGAFWIIAFHWGILGFAGWAFTTWMPTYLGERFKLTQAESGFTATAYMQVAAFAGVLVGGAWADRWSLTQLRGRVWVPMIALTLCSPFVFLTAHTSSLWLVAMSLMVFGFARGTSDSNMMPILCQVAEPRHRATGYGVLNFFSCCIGGYSSYLGGQLRDNHVEVSVLFMGSAVGVLVSGLLLALVKPKRR